MNGTKDIGKVDKRAEARYQNLDSLIGPLKRAAIDAYMRDLKFKLSGKFYEREERDPEDGPVTRYVHCPDDKGEGGRKYNTELLSDHYVHKFSEIRNKIDSILEPWFDLPNPGTIRTEMGDVGKVLQVLQAAPSEQGGVIAGAGTLYKTIKDTEEMLNQMASATVSSFSTNFVGKLDAITQNLTLGISLWGASLAAEKGIFKEARASVVLAVEKATTAFRKVAKKESDNFDFVLKVIKVAIGAYATFVNPTLSVLQKGVAYAQTGANGLGEIAGEDDERRVTKNVGSYAEGIKSLEDILHLLNDNIENAELKVEENIKERLKEMPKNKEAFDIEVQTIEDGETINQGKEVRIDPAYVEDITQRKLPEVAEEIRKAKGKMKYVSMSNCVSRHENIGIGPSGPSFHFDRMKWRLTSLLQELAWDVDNGNKDFELAMAYIRERGEASRKKLEAMNQKIKEGHYVDPWA